MDSRRNLRNTEVVRQLDSAVHMLQRRLHRGPRQTIPILSDAYPELSATNLLTVGLSFASPARHRFGTFNLENRKMITRPQANRPPSRSSLFCALPRKAERAEVRIVLLVLAAFLLGAAAGAYWVYRPREVGTPEPQSAAPNSSAGLSESTKKILSNLTAPVQIRFYSVLDPANTPEAWRAFAGRVDQLLVAFQHEANGKLILMHSNSLAYANAKSAMADGMNPFNEEKGEPSFLGIAVINQEQKASLPQLSPEWESALEADISRAILRTVRTAAPAAASGTIAAKRDSPSLDEIKRLVPNLESLSLADATRALREASFKEFATAATQFQTQLNEAQERLKTAQTGGSDAEQQAAVKNLQEVQAEQTARLKEIAAKSQAQVEALKQLKSGTR